MSVVVRDVTMGGTCTPPKTSVCRGSDRVEQNNLVLLKGMRIGIYEAQAQRKAAQQDEANDLRNRR